jgi:hypothetical protein
MTPKDFKTIHRANAVTIGLLALILIAFGAVSWVERIERQKPKPVDICLAPEFPFNAATSHAWDIKAAGGQMWVCAPDADHKTVHCMRMMPRSVGECIQWAKDFNRKAESQQK